jgi:adenosylhomocysteine nucleosidase
MLALIAALKEETYCLKRRMHIDKTTVTDNYRIFKGNYKGKKVLLVQTGMGRQRAEKAANFIIENYSIDALISFGFAGALTSEYKVGDICFCPTISCSDTQINITHKSDSTLISQCKKISLSSLMKAVEAKIVTTNKPVCPPEERKILALSHQCDIMDTETFWVAEIAQKKNITFLSIRVISDASDNTLPSFGYMLDSDGRWLWHKVILYFLSHPVQMIGLFRLYRHSNLARKNMTVFLDSLVEGI